MDNLLLLIFHVLLEFLSFKFELLLGLLEDDFFLCLVGLLFFEKGLILLYLLLYITQFLYKFLIFYSNISFLNRLKVLLDFILILLFLIHLIYYFLLIFDEYLLVVLVFLLQNWKILIKIVQLRLPFGKDILVIFVENHEILWVVGIEILSINFIIILPFFNWIYLLIPGLISIFIDDNWVILNILSTHFPTPSSCLLLPSSSLSLLQYPWIPPTPIKEVIWVAGPIFFGAYFWVVWGAHTLI